MLDTGFLQKQFDNIFGKEKIVEKDRNVYNTFKLPIHYLDKQVYKLNDVVLTDLELENTDEAVEIDTSSNYTNTMYDHLLEPSDDFSSAMITKVNKHYTTNVDYLKDTQKIIKNTPFYENDSVDCKKFLSIWKETKQNNYFLEKYHYVDWSMLKNLNKSSAFLGFVSVVNMSSPVLSFIIPFLFLIFPFIILKIQGIPITFNTYISLLKNVARSHIIGQILNMKNFSASSILYLLGTIGLYCLQIYQNINTCLKFYKNISKINTYIFELKQYLKATINKMGSFTKINKDVVHYQLFNKDINMHMYRLMNLQNQIVDIEEFSPSLSKVSEIGYLLKMFYVIYSDDDFDESLKYSVGFNGYMQNICEIYNNVKKGFISYASFNRKENTQFKNQYYPAYCKENHVKNNCVLDKNIITGPNASGKTTYLKTTALNIIFSQQYGVGFYGSCTLNPYEHIHSYLNIPDTSGRDSLFQAESRRCKEIIDIINENADERHFTIFDELFSGTNPSEATKSAYAFLLYLSDFANVDYILTTHYTSICKKLARKNKVQNYKMDVQFDENEKIQYTYKIKKGISKVQGAILILEEMNYPDEIIDNIKKY